MEEKKKLPVATITIALVTVISFLYSMHINQTVIEKGMAENVLIFEEGQYYRLFTACLLHSGIDHLFQNMLMFVCLGVLLEPETGVVIFSVVYVLSGVLGNFFSQGISYALGHNTASIGASGAVFGITGMLLFFVLINKGHYGSVTLRGILLMLALSLYNGIKEYQIDNRAHIAGFITGFVLTAFIFSMKRLLVHRNT